jgi:hypothetical protein
MSVERYVESTFDVGLVPLIVLVMLGAGVASTLLTGWLRAVLMAIVAAAMVGIFVLGWQAVSWHSDAAHKASSEAPPTPSVPQRGEIQPWGRQEQASPRDRRRLRGGDLRTVEST